jgi:hypothetical protein
MKILMLLTALFSLAAPMHPEPQKRKLSDTEAKAVVQAVEDEIYDYGYQKHFYQMGENIGTLPNAPRTRMRIYLEPEVNLTDESGRVIYKLIPYGEVLRDFIIRKNGLVVLAGDPQNGFPPTQESNTKTVYLDDDQVCRMKRDWLRRFFVVDDSPSPERLQEAVQRQKLRTGFSDWEYHHSNQHEKPNN